MLFQITIFFGTIDFTRFDGEVVTLRKAQGKYKNILFNGALAKRKRGCLQNIYAGVRFPHAPLEFAKQSAGQNSYAPRLAGLEPLNLRA